MDEEGVIGTSASSADVTGDWFESYGRRSAVPPNRGLVGRPIRPRLLGAVD